MRTASRVSSPSAAPACYQEPHGTHPIRVWVLLMRDWTSASQGFRKVVCLRSPSDDDQALVPDPRA